MTARVVTEADPAFDTEVPVAIIGAGAAGLVAALACRGAGVEPLVIERDAVPRGSTSLSAGLIPAAGTRFQTAHGIADSVMAFAADIQKKAHGEADPALVALVAREAAPAIDWLADAHGLPFSLVHDFDYPGHTNRRMHGLPSRSGAELVDRLRQAAEQADIPLLTEARVTPWSGMHRARCAVWWRSAPMAAPSASARAPSCWPAAAMRATRRWCGNTSPASRTRSISAIPAMRVRRCSGPSR